MPDVRLGDVVVLVWWVLEWRESRTEGEDERRRWKREGLRLGEVVVARGGEGSRRDPKSGILF